MSNDNNDNKPKIDWIAQIRYSILMVVFVVAVLALMRYFGMRG